jgi:hypothetical protein
MSASTIVKRHTGDRSGKLSYSKPFIQEYDWKIMPLSAISAQMGSTNNF